ncbi:hypothetical protein ACVNPX_08230 [Staphylococcus aureus]
MKLKTSAKATLALGLLTTGVIASKAKQFKQKKSKREYNIYMILKTYIDTTHQKVLNSVILVVRLKIITVLTLYALTKKIK